MRNGYACFLCGSHEYAPVYESTFAGDYQPAHVAITDNAYGLTGRVVRCAGCEMITVYPRPSEDELVGLYSQLVDPRYQEEEAGRRDSFRRTLRAAQRLGAPNTRVFDIGASTGVFIDEARRAGFDATGIEPSSWAVKMAKERFGHDVIEGVLPHAGAERSAYGMATMLDVIEHVDDPRQLTLDAAELLADGGLLVVTTPDYDSFISKRLKQKWWHCRLAHVQYFTPATLRRLLEACGFRVERVARFGWTFSLLYWMSRLERKQPVAALIRLLQSNGAGRFLLNRRVRINFRDSMTFFARLERRVSP